MNLRIPTPSWHDVVAADPQFADQVRRTFAVRKHATLATLRRDESPRSSGTGVDFAADGNLYLGRMPCSLKALDLRCDPRLALHCRTEDNPAGIGDPHRRTGHLAVAQQAAGLSSVRQCNASRGSHRRSSALSEQGILPR